MEYVRKIIRECTTSSEHGRIPIEWSAAKKDLLHLTAAGDIATHAAIDVTLAGPLLKCAEGGFREAEREIVDLLDQNLERCSRDPETYISFLNALFVVQRLDLVAALLKDKYAFPGELELAVEDAGRGIGIVRWEILPDSRHRFVFDAAVFRYDNTRIEILLFQWEFPLFAYYARQPDAETGTVVLNREDIGRVPGLAYCDSRPEYFLIPDYVFIPSRGYHGARRHFSENTVAWDSRQPMALWRGATTGRPTVAGDWRSLARVQLCEIARRYESTGLIDAGISSIAQIADSGTVEDIKKSGLLRGFVPWQTWNQYRYQIDIDGNSSPWSNLFQRLLTGSTVIKVESASGFRQWYYDDLIPWQNYVPVAPNMWDLIDKLKWLRRNDATAQRIGQSGLELAQRLTYGHEMRRTVPVITAALRHFSGMVSQETPSSSTTRVLETATPQA